MSAQEQSMRTFRRVVVVIATLGMTFTWTACSERNTTATQEKSNRPVAAMPSDIRSDEVVVFFLTAAHLDETNQQWVIPIHGVIYEPEQDSTRRAAVAGAIRQAVQTPADASESQRLDQRVRLFLVDNERGKGISVRIGSETYDVGSSESNGHFQGSLCMSPAQIGPLLSAQDGDADKTLSFTAVTKASDDRTFDGRVQVIPPQGLSVISDIDDTIKHSQVTDRRAVLANTFLREFQPVPGMPELYRQWAQQGIVFHYVSGSPWQLYVPLAEFFRAQQLPVASIDLKYFRLKDPSTLDLSQSQDMKVRAIEPILQAFPQRRFILIGDSGEQDPETYAQIARAHKQQVVAIFIRNVTQEQADNARISPLCQGLDSVRFLLFEDPTALQPIMDEIGSAETAAPELPSR